MRQGQAKHEAGGGTGGPGAPEVSGSTGPGASPAPDFNDERVLVWAASEGQAADTSEDLRRSGFECTPCASPLTFCREVAAGAGAAIVADDALTAPSIARLARALGQQPAWSDLPVILLSQPEAPAETVALVERFVPTANVTVLEWPARASTLRSVVHTALRARRCQYWSRDLHERLARADRHRDEFHAMLGHELRNPLAAIRSATALLGRDGGGAARADRLRSVIDRQSRHLTRMVEDLLDATRVSGGDLALRPEPVDLNAVVARAQRARESRAQGRGEAALHVALAGAPVVVDGDPARLEQVVANLLDNALKYTSGRGQVLVTVGVVNERALLRVTDDGIGIEGPMLPRVFDEFTQAPLPLDRAPGGLGLGLSLVRRIVELHGGEVRATSPGLRRGATFEVSLPLRGGTTSNAAQPPTSRALGRPSGGRLVLIEDNVDIRECLAELLRTWGYEVAQAGDGRTGLELVLGLRPTAAIVDVGLPGLDGYDVASRVRARLGPRGVRLIAITGYGQPADRERAFRAGFDEHLVKPVSPEELARLLPAARTDDPAAGD